MLFQFASFLNAARVITHASTQWTHMHIYIYSVGIDLIDLLSFYERVDARNGFVLTRRVFPKNEKFPREASWLPKPFFRFDFVMVTEFPPDRETFFRWIFVFPFFSFVKKVSGFYFLSCVFCFVLISAASNTHFGFYIGSKGAENWGGVSS